MKQSGSEAASEAEKSVGSKKGDKWRQKEKQFTSMRSSSEDQVQIERGEEVLEDEATPTSTPLCHAQVIDAETRMEGIRPFTVYIIMSRRLGG